jgi:hypothetical protein
VSEACGSTALQKSARRRSPRFRSRTTQCAFSVWR